MNKTERMVVPKSALLITYDPLQIKSYQIFISLSPYTWQHEACTSTSQEGIVSVTSFPG